MTRSRAIRNRRHEPRRQYLLRAFVAWRRHGAAMWRRGWLNDISVSGASLLVSTEGQPNAGQEIDLLPRYSEEAVLCRVVRIRFRKDDQGLIACRIVSADGYPALLKPAPNAGTARQEVLGRAWPPGLRLHSPHDVVCRRSA